MANPMPEGERTSPPPYAHVCLSVMTMSLLLHGILFNLFELLSLPGISHAFLRINSYTHTRNVCRAILRILIFSTFIFSCLFEFNQTCRLSTGQRLILRHEFKGRRLFPPDGLFRDNVERTHCCTWCPSIQ